MEVLTGDTRCARSARDKSITASSDKKRDTRRAGGLDLTMFRSHRPAGPPSSPPGSSDVTPFLLRQLKDAKAACRSLEALVEDHRAEAYAARAAARSKDDIVRHLEARLEDAERHGSMDPLPYDDAQRQRDGVPPPPATPQPATPSSPTSFPSSSSSSSPSSSSPSSSSSSPPFAAGRGGRGGSPGQVAELAEANRELRVARAVEREAAREAEKEAAAARWRAKEAEREVAELRRQISGWDGEGRVKEEGRAKEGRSSTDGGKDRDGGTAAAGAAALAALQAALDTSKQDCAEMKRRHRKRDAATAAAAAEAAVAAETEAATLKQQLGALEEAHSQELQAIRQKEASRERRKAKEASSQALSAQAPSQFTSGVRNSLRLMRNAASSFRDRIDKEELLRGTGFFAHLR